MLELWNPGPGERLNGPPNRAPLPRWLVSPTAIVRLSLVLGLAPLLGLFGRHHWILDLFSHFQAQYAFFLGVATLVLLVGRKFRQALIAAMILLIPLVQLAPLYRPSGKAGEGPALRIATFNVLSSNQRYADTIEWTRSTDPDLIFFPETNSVWATELTPLLTSFPHRLEEIREGNFGFSLFSKHPIRRHSIVDMGDLEIPVLIAEIETPHGRFTFIGAHPVPPVSEFWAKERDHLITQLAALVDRQPGRLIIGGDLNATRWSAAVVPLFHRGMRDSASSHGFSATWMRRNPLTAIPIDHLLFRGFPLCISRITGPDLGSDHRPISADFRW